MIIRTLGSSLKELTVTLFDPWASRTRDSVTQLWNQMLESRWLEPATRNNREFLEGKWLILEFARRV